MKCSIDNCPRPVVAKGYCSRHIQAAYKFGRPAEEVCFLDNFWSQVAICESGCFEWQGAIAGKYGQVAFLGTSLPAHRVVYRLYVGEVNALSLVCHICDNPICVRPDHLFLGTAADNMRDMVSKGRHPKQRASYRAKLDANKVAMIRASKETTVSLARLLGVDPNTVRKVRSGETWIQ